ncbi:unnamed protein product [Peniophora sp. CBMAI 1063]|nr:unnamed protein product [Peniophora sp. CBMAI 1063]
MSSTSTHVPLQFPISAHDLARVYIKMEHIGATVLKCTFGDDVALDRAERFVFAAADRAIQAGQTEDVFVSRSYYSWRAAEYAPYGLPPDAIGFDASHAGQTSASDVFETLPDALGLPFPRWCILDVRVPDPTRIIPARMLNLYLSQPIRSQSELQRTDMLPVWFWNNDGSLGIPITAPTFDRIPDIPTRIHATSLKVGFWWHNYGPLEKQIQLRTKESRKDTSGYCVSLRRLATATCKAVKNAMAVYENGDIVTGRTQWEELRWRIGTGPGCVSVRDVVLLGLVYVSPGRVMPLLRL